jgi:hypothetical protein
VAQICQAIRGLYDKGQFRFVFHRHLGQLRMAQSFLLLTRAFRRIGQELHAVGNQVAELLHDGFQRSLRVLHDIMQEPHDLCGSPEGLEKMHHLIQVVHIGMPAVLLCAVRFHREVTGTADVFRTE